MTELENTQRRKYESIIHLIKRKSASVLFGRAQLNLAESTWINYVILQIRCKT